MGQVAARFEAPQQRAHAGIAERKLLVERRPDLLRGRRAPGPDQIEDRQDNPQDARPRPEAEQPDADDETGQRQRERESHQRHSRDADERNRDARIRIA